MNKKLTLTLGDALLIYKNCDGNSCENCPLFNKNIQYCSFEDITDLKLQDIIDLKWGKSFDE